MKCFRVHGLSRTCRVSLLKLFVHCIYAEKPFRCFYTRYIMWCPDLMSFKFAVEKANAYMLSGCGLPHPKVLCKLGMEQGHHLRSPKWSRKIDRLKQGVHVGNRMQDFLVSSQPVGETNIKSSIFGII